VIRRIEVVDSHTEGEPTRVVLSGGPTLPAVSVAEQAEILRRDHDLFRSAVVNEPRGNDAIVGALLCTPSDPSCVAGVVFFNNVGYIHMCVHGTIGFIVSLAHLGKITPGEHRIETPVGVVTATLSGDSKVTVANVPSYRSRTGVTIEPEGYGPMTGDIAWGGNWFFLVEDHGQTVAANNIEQLTHCSWAIRQCLESEGITGENGGEIDHIELYAPPLREDCHSKNFVLCPGKAYDRSPCGTGTSAKLACLVADGKLKPGEVWRQESVVGTSFDGEVRIEVTADGKEIIPVITGTAFVTAESTLLFHEDDPFADGIRK